MICYEYALYAADTFAKLPREGKPEPLRFIYVSGSNAERDPAKKPWILGDYCLLRVCYPYNPTSTSNNISGPSGEANP